MKYKANYVFDALPGPNDILLLVEVADTTLRFGNSIKLPLYAANEIQYVWLVDLKAKQLTCYAEPVNGQYSVQTVVSDLSQVPLPFAAGISIDISPIFRFD